MSTTKEKMSTSKRFIKLSQTILLSFALLNSVFPAYAEIPEIRLRKSMSYLDARTLLINAGWQYADLPAYGYNESDPKVISECFGEIRICNKYPEIEHCSGQGYCKMLFYDHFGNKLAVTTYGPLTSEKLHIIGWSLDRADNQ